MSNLLKETIQELLDNGKVPNDVKWVGNNKIWFTWEEFSKIADFTYDHSYGIQKIKEELVVVGDDWWLERMEYDGSEWWEFKTFPLQNKRILQKPTKIDLISEDFLNSTEYKKKEYTEEGRTLIYGKLCITDKDLQWFLDN